LFLALIDAARGVHPAGARPCRLHAMANNGVALLSLTDEMIKSRNFCCTAYVRFWHKADIPVAPSNVRFRE